MQPYPDPLQHFAAWYHEAEQTAGLDHPAMVLATASNTARPSSRVIYFRGLVDGAFSFYTNYHSRKGQELATNAHAALLFHWQPLERQIRIEGTVHKLSRAASERYFAARTLAKQISTTISQQSQTIPSYQSLREEFAQAQQQYASHTSLPCPPHWGGYGLTPHYFEFYIADEHRLSQRLAYQHTDDAKWQTTYLSP